MHKAGVKHEAADVLCTLRTYRVDSTELEGEITGTVVAWMKNQASMKESVVPSWTQKRKLLPKTPDEPDARLPTLSEFIITQSKDAFCENCSQLVGTSGSDFTFDENGNLVRKAGIDWLIPKVVNKS